MDGFDGVHWGRGFGGEAMSGRLSQNRLYRGDCLQAMRRLREENIQADLIYLDPPFNSNRVYNIVFRGGGKGAEQVAFSDMWGGQHAEQLRIAFVNMLGEMEIAPALRQMMEMWVQVLLESGDDDDRRLLNYLVYMTQRLIAMREVLSPRGSIYLHCDPTASHYLKVVMDAVFGRKNFRNEVIWHYAKIGVAKKKWTANTDHILFYSVSDDYAFQYQVQDRPNEIAARFSRLVRDNKLFYGDLKTRHDSITQSKIRVAERRLGRGLKDSDVVIDFDDEANKKRMDNVWHIPSLKGNSAEYMGYKTQKPLALLERIVLASCPKGGLVLDPFCGCGTAVEAAHKHGRRWIGVDISMFAIEHIKERAAERLNLKPNHDYEEKQCDPQTMLEYVKLTPYEKQKYLVEQVGGVVGPRGADGGVDGTIRIHLGGEGDSEKWGDFIVSVKTGGQAQPAHLDQLEGVMKRKGAKMGGLILDKEPTKPMQKRVDNSAALPYQTGRFSAKYKTLQILTADEVISGVCFDHPPTLTRKKLSHNRQGNL